MYRHYKSSSARACTSTWGPSEPTGSASRAWLCSRAGPRRSWYYTMKDFHLKNGSSQGQNLALTVLSVPSSLP